MTLSSSFRPAPRRFIWIKRFCKENPGFTRRVANDDADAQFNPLADYYASPERAKANSQKAVNRDIDGLLDQMRRAIGI